MSLRAIAGAALLVLALPLGGCVNPLTSVTSGVSAIALVTGLTVTQGQASALHSTIAALEKTTDGYLETCIKPGNSGLAGCDKATVGTVARYLSGLRSADDALFKALQAAQLQGAGVNVASTTYNAAVSAANAVTAAKPS